MSHYRWPRRYSVSRDSRWELTGLGDTRRWRNTKTRTLLQNDVTHTHKFASIIRKINQRLNSIHQKFLQHENQSCIYAGTKYLMYSIDCAVLGHVVCLILICQLLELCLDPFGCSYNSGFYTTCIIRNISSIAAQTMAIHQA